jgi:hypothetical protein
MGWIGCTANWWKSTPSPPQLAKFAHCHMSDPTSNPVLARAGWQRPATEPSMTRMAPPLPPTDFSPQTLSWRWGQLTGGTHARSPNAMRGTHTRVNAATRRDTIMTLRGQGRRCPEMACVMPINHRPSSHQATFLGTPMRSCVVSPSSTPPVIRRSNFAQPQVARRQPRAAAKRHHSTPLSMKQRWEPGAARRGASNILSRLRSRLTTMAAMMRKQVAPVWGTSQPPHSAASARHGLL